MNSQFEQYSDAKAFIKGGNIYINLANASPEDLMHEYAHVLLAYLKNNDQYREGYKKLIEAVWKYGNTNRRNAIINSDAYKNSSMEDKMEEFFVSEFGFAGIFTCISVLPIVATLLCCPHDNVGLPSVTLW